MSDLKAIFIDMDGTLLNHTTGQIPQTAIDALWRAHHAGFKLFIATGRNKQEVDRVDGLNDLPLDGFITLNGTLCYADNKVIYKNPIRRESVAQIVEHITQNPFPIMFCEEGKMYLSTVTPQVKKLQATVSLPVPDVGDAQWALDADVFQMVAFANEHERKFLRTVPGVRLTRWTCGGYDIVAETANKWDGILHVLKYYQIVPRGTFAIGDAENDIEMLKNAGFSVAMGNASDEVKKHANYVTTHIDDDGFAKAIDYIMGAGGRNEA